MNVQNETISKYTVVFPIVPNNPSEWDLFSHLTAVGCIACVG
jgi:hypothetical protein